ncbi:hypothetical protein FRC07_009427 [Ceratobasidium sp. 392]|nr:hypothetical protein FRC07_009427 [Ceratobasidium sp. 392]
MGSGRNAARPGAGAAGAGAELPSFVLKSGSGRRAGDRGGLVPGTDAENLEPVLNVKEPAPVEVEAEKTDVAAEDVLVEPNMELAPVLAVLVEPVEGTR